MMQETAVHTQSYLEVFDVAEGDQKWAEELLAQSLAASHCCSANSSHKQLAEQEQTVDGVECIQTRRSAAGS